MMVNPGLMLLNYGDHDGYTAGVAVAVLVVFVGHRPRPGKIFAAKSSSSFGRRRGRVMALEPFRLVHQGNYQTNGTSN